MQNMTLNNSSHYEIIIIDKINRIIYIYVYIWHLKARKLKLNQDFAEPIGLIAETQFSHCLS